MSYTDTQCVASDGLSHVPETALRNYAQVEGVEQSVEDTRPSLRLTMFSSREEILAFLMADPPKQTSSDTNEAAAAPNTDHRPGKENEDSGMQRDQSMVALKQELAEIDTNADDELFKFSNLNVGKYVLGPMSNGNTSIESDDSRIVKSRRAIEASDDQGVAIAEDIGTGGSSPGEGVEVDDPSFPRLKNSGLGEDLAVGCNEIVDAKVNRAVAAGGSDNLTEIVDEIVVDDSKVPRDPPNTPAIEERIWWKNDFIVIKKSTLGGLGVFAAKDLEYGDKILEEMPLLHTNNWGISNKYDSLSDEDRELVHTLHKFSTNPSAHVLEKIRRANSFQLPKGVAIYSVASRFNHACLPIRNVNYVINGRGDAKITFTVSKNVPKGTELTICYGGRPEQLLRGFGFRCKCGGCDSLTDKEVESIMKTLRGDGNWTNPW